MNSISKKIRKEEKSIDYNDIQKMTFIYNAINDGWTIRKIDNNKFELLKDKEEIILEDYIQKYLSFDISGKKV